MWRNTGQPVRVLMLDARACLPILCVMVYWSWPTLYIAIIGVDVLLDDLVLRPDLAGDVAADPALAGRHGPNGRSGLEPAEARVSAVERRRGLAHDGGASRARRAKHRLS